MLSRENFTEEYVRQLQKTSKRDPVLLERVIYAFAESLQRALVN